MFFLYVLSSACFVLFEVCINRLAIHMLNQYIRFASVDKNLFTYGFQNFVFVAGNQKPRKQRLLSTTLK